MQNVRICEHIGLIGQIISQPSQLGLKIWGFFTSSFNLKFSCSCIPYSLFPSLHKGMFHNVSTGFDKENKTHDFFLLRG